MEAISQILNMSLCRPSPNLVASVFVICALHCRLKIGCRNLGCSP